MSEIVDISEIVNLNKNDFKKEIEKVNDIELLKAWLSYPGVSVDKKEIIEERLKKLESKPKKDLIYLTKKRRKSYIFCNFIGAGGCGTQLTLHLYYELYKKYRAYLDYCDFIIYDLSIDIHNTFDKFKEKFKNDKEFEVEVEKYTLGFSRGAGRIAKFTEYVLEAVEGEKVMKEIVPRTRNYGFASLGGGTGSRMIPYILEKAKTKGYDCIGLGVITNEYEELPNHIYTIPLFLKSTDITIFIEREAMEIQNNNTKTLPFEERVCDIVCKIIPMFEATLAKPEGSEQAHVYPQLQDLGNYKTLLSYSKTYRKGIHWLIPFYYEWNTKDEVKPLEIIYNTLERPLVRLTNKEKEIEIEEVIEFTNKAKTSIVILEVSSDEYSKIIENYKRLKEYLRGIVCHKNSKTVKCIIIENNKTDKCKSLILVHGIPFEKFEEICSYDVQDLDECIEAWIFRLKEELKRSSQKDQNTSEGNTKIIQIDVGKLHGIKVDEKEIRQIIEEKLKDLKEMRKLIEGGE